MEGYKVLRLAIGACVLFWAGIGTIVAIWIS